LSGEHRDRGSWHLPPAVGGDAGPEDLQWKNDAADPRRPEVDLQRPNEAGGFQPFDRAQCRPGDLFGQDRAGGPAEDAAVRPELGRPDPLSLFQLQLDPDPVSAEGIQILMTDLRGGKRTLIPRATVMIENPFTVADHPRSPSYGGPATVVSGSIRLSDLPLFPYLTATISARMLTAISAVVWAPRSRPTGTRMRASCRSSTPFSLKRSKIALPRRRLPSSPMYGTSLRKTRSRTGMSYL